MIAWGGYNAGDVGSGGRYDPATDSWTQTNLTGAPTPRGGHAAVWTGSRMVVWGGGFENSGGIYDPSTDSWTATTGTGAPTPRSYHTAVWTGSTMIVWGGNTNTGAVYANPAVVPPAPAPADFYTVMPCRLVDTRDTAGATGAPALVGGGAIRNFPVAGACGIPPTATAVSLNVTAVGAVAPGHLTLYPGDGVGPPLASSVNFSPGVTRANNAIVRLAVVGGTINVKNGSAAPVHLVLDVNGYLR
jgi:hypothetical protein